MYKSHGKIRGESARKISMNFTIPISIETIGPMEIYHILSYCTTFQHILPYQFTWKSHGNNSRQANPMEKSTGSWRHQLGHPENRGVCRCSSVVVPWWESCLVQWVPGCKVRDPPVTACSKIIINHCLTITMWGPYLKKLICTRGYRMLLTGVNLYQKYV